MIDVPHNGNDRCARLNRLGIILIADKAIFDIGFGDALDGMTEFLSDQLGGIRVEHIGNLVHRALFHQMLDDVGGTLAHAI